MTTDTVASGPTDVARPDKDARSAVDELAEATAGA
jgi:hypothetical protein